MKWKTPVSPKLGDEKTEVQFAFFPIYTDNGYTVWLEWYKVHLRYETRKMPTKGGSLPRTRWFIVSTEIYTRQKSILNKVESTMTNELREYDDNGNEIHYRDSSGYEVWYEYDTNGKEIHSRNSTGYEWWYEYDANGNCIHYRTSNGYEWWCEYDEHGNLINLRANNV